MQKIKDILRIGIPIMLGQACIIILSFADNIMIGWYGVEELAASSFVNGIINLFIFTELGFACGLTPVVGSLYGRGDNDGIGKAVKDSLAVNGAVGGAGLLALAVIYAYLDRFGQEPDLLPLIKPYFIVIGISTVFALGFNTLKQFTDGICRPAVSMSILMGGNLLNIFGNWVLIYGKCGFPELGLLGAGLSTLISRIIMLVVFAFWIMGSRRFRTYREAFIKSKITRRGIRRLFGLGYPLALQTGMETSTFSVSAIMAGWIGATTLAAHQVTITISQICFMMMMGLATAVSVLVSNSFGKKDMKAVREYSSKGYLMILAVSTFFCTAIWIFRYPIIGMFTDSPEVTMTVLSLLIVLFTYQIGDGLQLCYSNALRGIQDVKPIMLMAFVSYYLIAIPSAYFLGFKAGLGITGIWIGFPVGLTTAGIFYYLRFRYRTRSKEKVKART